MMPLCSHPVRSMYWAAACTGPVVRRGCWVCMLGLCSLEKPYGNFWKLWLATVCKLGGDVCVSRQFHKAKRSPGHGEAHTRQPSIGGLKLSECLHCEAMLNHTVFRPGKTLHLPQTKIRVLGYRWFTGEVLALQV